MGEINCPDPLGEFHDAKIYVARRCVGKAGFAGLLCNLSSDFRAVVDVVVQMRFVEGTYFFHNILVVLSKAHA